MPVVINRETGLAETLAPDQATGALQKGTHDYPMINPEGEHVTMPYEDAAEAAQQGYRQPNETELGKLTDYAKYSTPIQKMEAAAEGLASGALSKPVGDYLAQAIAGAKPEDIKARAEIHPVTHAIAETLGLISPVGLGEKLAKAGELAAKGAEFAEMGRVGQAATRGLTEMALYQTQDEVGKYLLETDPREVSETALANIGISALIGAGGGAVLGAAGKAWDALAAGKAGKFVEDFKSGIKHKLEYPNPERQITEELTNLHETLHDMNDKVWGANGTKQQAIASHLPEEISDAMAEHNLSIANKLDEARAKLERLSPRFADDLQKEVETFSKATQEAKTPLDMFNASNELKQRLGQFAKFEKQVAPLSEEARFVDAVKDVYNYTKKSLEDTKVWGKAGDLQAKVNKAFSEYFPTLKDFEKKFTGAIGGERVIDPDKIATYVKQTMNEKGSLKKEIVENFLQSSEKYQREIEKVHADLGAEFPFGRTSTAATEGTLAERTLGEKAADALVQKGIGTALGGALGAKAGALFGHATAGAVLGAKYIGGPIDSIVKSIIKPIMLNPSSGAGLKAAIEFSTAAVKGDAMLTKAAKSVFGAVPFQVSSVTAKERDAIKAKIDHFTAKPEALLDVGGHVGHYMGGHGEALAETAGRVTSYLAQQRPKTDPRAPLDKAMKPSAADEARYNEAIDIAQRPALLMLNVKDGSITKLQMQHLGAIYPQLMQTMQRKVGEAMVEAKDSGKLIPYKTQLGASIFLGQPLTASLTQPAIMAAQPIPVQAPQAMPKPKHSMSKLDKMPNLSQTNQGARSMFRASRQK